MAKDRVLPAALERSAFALCIVCVFLNPRQKENTSVIAVPELFILTELSVLMWGEHKSGQGWHLVALSLKDLVQPVTNFRAVNHLCW